MEKIAALYSNQNIEFLFVYIIEPHAGEMNYERIVQPETFEQRKELARATIGECNIQRKTVIDTMDNDFYMKFGGCPNMVYIIDPEGIIVYHDRWNSSHHVHAFLERLTLTESR